VHSPFVYQFIEQVLKQVNQYRGPQLEGPVRKLPAHYQSLLALTATTYQLGTPLEIKASDDHPVPPGCFYLLNDREPGHWVRLCSQLAAQWGASATRPDTLIVIPGIHLTARHTAKWKRLRPQSQNRLCIDLLDVGLIWLRQAFHAPQFFVLR